jgi:hypothetical protein
MIEETTVLCRSDLKHLFPEATVLLKNFSESPKVLHCVLESAEQTNVHRPFRQGVIQPPSWSTHVASQKLVGIYT